MEWGLGGLQRTGQTERQWRQRTDEMDGPRTARVGCRCVCAQWVVVVQLECVMTYQGGERNQGAGSEAG